MLRKAIWALPAALCFLAAACASYNQSPSPAASSAASSPAQTVSAQTTPPSQCPPPTAVPATMPGVPTVAPDAKTVTTPSGLQYIDLVPGSGPAAQSGQSATVQYTGWLVDGKKFDSSRDRGQPFTFPLGGGQVIKGWDEGVATMHVGGQRRLIVPPNLGYGARQGGGVIPPCSTLVFDVELVGVK